MRTSSEKTEKKSVMTRTKVLPLALLWAGVCLLLSLLVRLPVFFAGSLAEIFDPTIGSILAAWQEASVSIPLWLLLPCGLILTIWEGFLIHKTRNKAPAIRIAWILTGILTGLILLVGFTLLLLWNSKINGIPVSVIARILSDLAGRL